jgi:hypothetical protein
MSLASAFVEYEAHARSVVMHNTWGHLAPEPRRDYPGTILFTQTEYGDLVPIRSRFTGLPDSPWFHQHLCDFVADKATEPGVVYRFEGKYMMFKNGNARFSGKVRKVRID